MTQHTDWLTDLYRTGDWCALAEWLARHDTYLALSMAIFADSMRRSTRAPTPSQMGLLISLRGGVEALMRWGDIQHAPTPVGDSYADAALSDDAAASAAEGAKLLASVLRPAPWHAPRAPAERTGLRCGVVCKTTLQPCTHPVSRPGAGAASMAARQWGAGRSTDAPRVLH